jgi:hypothetical protein
LLSEIKSGGVGGFSLKNITVMRKINVATAASNMRKISTYFLIAILLVYSGSKSTNKAGI